MTKPIAHILNDLHIGRINSKIDYNDEFQRFADWFFDNWKVDSPKVLILAGDTFDSKRTLTPQAHRTARRFFKLASEHYDKVYAIIGNHDCADTKKLNVNLFDMFDLPLNFEIIDEPKSFKIGKGQVMFFPYKTYDSGKIDGCSAIVSHESLGSDMIGDSDVPVFNGHIHTRGKFGSIYNLGSPYQLDWSELNEIGGFHVLMDDYTVENIPYDRSIYHSVRLENGKVDGINPIKWLTNNRERLIGTSLEIVVDEETDRTLYDKFQHVLSTIRLRELRMTDNISFSSKPLSENSMSIVDAIDVDLTRPGAKRKLQDIVSEIHNAH